jgi:hypothetical protein
MDPSTTLFTFLLQTDPKVQTVHLVGSWDNFTTSYTMERDVRRGRGQWKGCYSFKDVSSHGSKGNGGLKMGHTYYYYVRPRHPRSAQAVNPRFLTAKLQYEVDGSTETYDPTLPSTTACPYLPGQTLNTLAVPLERNLHNRTASLSSMHLDNFKTMDPQAKYATPQPGSLPSRHQRLGSAPAHFRHPSTTPATRSQSPAPAPAPAWKRIFGRKTPAPERLPEWTPQDEVTEGPVQASLDSRSTTPSDGTRSRAMSPDYLSLFLTSVELPSEPAEPVVEQRANMTIPEDIVEENEDDDNFATSAISEVRMFPTSLSPPPPPFRRAASSDAMNARSRSRSLPIASRPAIARPSSEGHAPQKARAVPLTLNTAPHTGVTFLHIPPSIIDSPSSTLSPLDELTSSYESNDEDDDVFSSNDEDTPSYRRPAVPSSRRYGFMGYSLPQQIEGKNAMASDTTITIPNSPPLLAHGDPSNFLGSPIDTGLDDFVSELGWAVQSIGSKHS